MKKFVLSMVLAGGMLLPFAGGALAAAPGAEVNNPNANANACWGQDRSFYASGSDFKEIGGNMDIKRSFAPENGKVGEQRADWVATYCDPHGPTE